MEERLAHKWRATTRKRGPYFMAFLIHENGTVHCPTLVPHKTRIAAKHEGEDFIQRWEALEKDSDQ